MRKWNRWRRGKRKKEERWIIEGSYVVRKDEKSGNDDEGKDSEEGINEEIYELTKAKGMSRMNAEEEGIWEVKDVESKKKMMRLVEGIQKRGRKRKYSDGRRNNGKGMRKRRN